MIDAESMMAGVELVVIDGATKLRSLKTELRQNDLYYVIAQGLRN